MPLAPPPLTALTHKSAAWDQAQAWDVMSWTSIVNPEVQKSFYTFHYEAVHPEFQIYWSNLESKKKTIHFFPYRYNTCWCSDVVTCSCISIGQTSNRISWGHSFTRQTNPISEANTSIFVWMPKSSGKIWQTQWCKCKTSQNVSATHVEVEMYSMQERARIERITKR